MSFRDNKLGPNFAPHGPSSSSFVAGTSDFVAPAVPVSKLPERNKPAAPAADTTATPSRFWNPLRRVLNPRIAAAQAKTVSASTKAILALLEPFESAAAARLEPGENRRQRVEALIENFAATDEVRKAHQHLVNLLNDIVGLPLPEPTNPARTSVLEARTAAVVKLARTVAKSIDMEPALRDLLAFSWRDLPTRDALGTREWVKTTRVAVWKAVKSEIAGRFPDLDVPARLLAARGAGQGGLDPDGRELLAAWESAKQPAPPIRTPQRVVSARDLRVAGSGTRTPLPAAPALPVPAATNETPVRAEKLSFSDASSPGPSTRPSPGPSTSASGRATASPSSSSSSSASPRVSGLPNTTPATGPRPLPSYGERGSPGRLVPPVPARQPCSQLAVDLMRKLRAERTGLDVTRFNTLRDRLVDALCAEQEQLAMRVLSLMGSDPGNAFKGLFEWMQSGQPLSKVDDDTTDAILRLWSGGRGIDRPREGWRQARVNALVRLYEVLYEDTAATPASFTDPAFLAVQMESLRSARLGSRTFEMVRERLQGLQDRLTAPVPDKVPGPAPE